MDRSAAALGLVVTLQLLPRGKGCAKLLALSPLFRRDAGFLGELDCLGSRNRTRRCGDRPCSCATGSKRRFCPGGGLETAPTLDRLLATATARV